MDNLLKKINEIAFTTIDVGLLTCRDKIYLAFSDHVGGMEEASELRIFVNLNFFITIAHIFWGTSKHLQQHQIVVLSFLISRFL